MHPALSTLKIGDTIIALNNPDDLEKRLKKPLRLRISKILDDHVVAGGRKLTPNQLLSQGLLIVPKRIPPEVKAFIRLQDDPDDLVCVRSLGDTGDAYTIASLETGDRVQRTIHTTEAVDLTFSARFRHWSEGKPEVTDCYTETEIDSATLNEPDRFHPEAYV
jgi:hypothetical protein